MEDRADSDFFCAFAACSFDFRSSLDHADSIMPVRSLLLLLDTFPKLDFVVARK